MKILVALPTFNDHTPWMLHAGPQAFAETPAETRPITLAVIHEAAAASAVPSMLTGILVTGRDMLHSAAVPGQPG